MVNVTHNNNTRRSVNKLFLGINTFVKQLFFYGNNNFLCYLNTHIAMWPWPTKAAAWMRQK